MAKGYVIGAIGSLSFAFCSFIYVIGRYIGLFSNLLDHLIFIMPDSFFFRIIYTIMVFSLVIMAIGGVQFYEEFRLASPAILVLILGIIGSIFSSIFYPMLIYEPLEFSYIQAVLHFIPNLILGAFFILFSATILVYSQTTKKSRNLIISGVINLIFSILYIVFSIFTMVASNDYRWSYYHSVFGYFFILLGPENYLASPFTFIFSSQSAHLPLLNSFFNLWFFALLPLGINAFMISSSFNLEYNRYIKDFNYIKNNRVQVEDKIEAYIAEVKESHDGVTINAICSDIGYRPAAIKPVFRDMLNKEQIPGKYKFNVLRITNGYNIHKMSYELNYSYKLQVIDMYGLFPGYEGIPGRPLLEYMGRPRAVNRIIRREKVAQWNCKYCHAPINKEKVQRMQSGKVVTCEYCGNSLSRAEY